MNHKVTKYVSAEFGPDGIDVTLETHEGNVKLEIPDQEALDLADGIENAFPTAPSHDEVMRKAAGS